VRQVEPQDGEQTVAFIFCTEDALRDVAAAARFRARIPERPPLHRKMHNECNHRQRPHSFAGKPSRKIRQESGNIAGA